jgi:hypothetical protein
MELRSPLVRNLSLVQHQSLLKRSWRHTQIIGV